MKKWILLVAILSALGFTSFTQQSNLNNQTETIVFMRHAEKPLLDFGQLNCQGLNRMLALPKVLKAKFGKPDYIFAPNPYWEGFYYYVRAFATIEPTAIELGLPVNTDYKFHDIDEVAQALIEPQYHGLLLYVVWEHLSLVRITKKIMKLLDGDESIVPSWPANDYDSLYILSIDWGTQAPKIRFTHDHEELNDQSKTCPSDYRAKPPTQNHSWGFDTFVFIPEAEPIAAGYDQLSCKGLNRALALPKMLSQVYATIDLFVLPAPHSDKSYFRRALMTIEPTIIHRGSLYIPSGQDSIKSMVDYLKSDECIDQTTVIAWPKEDLANLAQSLYKEYGGDPSEIPNPVSSSDTIYEIKVSHSAIKASASFKIVKEYLDDQPKLCP